MWVKSAIQQSNFCNVQNLILPRIEKNQKRRKKAEFVASLSITWLISRAFWHFSEETRGAFHLGKKTGNFDGSKSGISDW